MFSLSIKLGRHLISKYEQQLRSSTNALKTIRKTVEVTGDLVGKKLQTKLQKLIQGAPQRIETNQRDIHK